MRELMHELASKLTREVMCEHQLKQTDMLDIFGSQGVVSQVLNGKRQISLSQNISIAFMLLGLFDINVNRFWMVGTQII